MEVVSAEFDALRTLQADSIQALDTKAGVVLGFAGTIMAVLAVMQQTDTTWLSIIGFLLIAVAAGLGVWAMLPRDFHYWPKPSVLLNDYMLKDPDVPTTGSREQILADKVNAYEQNEKILAGKARLVTWSAVSLGAGIIFIWAHSLWRKPMTTENKTTSGDSASASAPATPAPVAQPNPAAMNTIKKGSNSSSSPK